MSYVLYIASTLGAVALFMMMSRRGYTPAKLGALLGGATLGGLWLYLAQHHLPPKSQLGLESPAMAYYYVFSGLAIAAAVRVITHTQPVYAALWFVMVVMASAGLMLVLSAEFLAVAMVIIYGGAILVTYVFVIMLATQSTDPSDLNDAPEYDRVAREPAAAVVVGFILLAVLLSVAFDRTSPEPNQFAAAPTDAQIITGGPDSDGILTRRPGYRLAESNPAAKALFHVDTLDNVERIGLDLFRGHPLGLELAGVILLVSLVGAVVIARQRVAVDF